MGRGAAGGRDDYFGGRNARDIIGILCTGVAFGTLIGPSAGFASDHSYTAPILAGAGASIIAAIIIASTSRMAHRLIEIRTSG
jgi:hypothetical protein